MANQWNNNGFVNWCDSFNGEKSIGTENGYAQHSFTKTSEAPVVAQYASNVYRFGGNGGEMPNEIENWKTQPSFTNTSNVPVSTPHHQWNSNGYGFQQPVAAQYASNVYRFGGNGGEMPNEIENWYAQPSFTNTSNVPVSTPHHQWNSNGYGFQQPVAAQYAANVYRFGGNGGEMSDYRSTHEDASVEKQNSNLVSQLECETTNLEKECGRSDLVSQNALQKTQASNVEHVPQTASGEKNQLVNFLNYLYEKHESMSQQDVNDSDHFLDVGNIEEKAKPMSKKRLPKKISEMQFPVQSTVKPKQVRGCDNSDMYVETSNAGVKKQCCPFCSKLIAKLPRHMEDIHGSQPAVQEFLKYPKNSAERKAILDDLRKTGNFDHNRIAELNKKLYIPSRRPNVNHKREAFQHTFCPYCRGSYTSKALRLHIKYRCPKKPKVDDEKLKGGRVERVTRYLAAAVDGRIHESASIKLENLLQTKKGEDDVMRLIRFDWLLVLYGNKLCKKYTRLKNRPMIRSRLRLGGRLLTALKSIQPEITDFASLYIPKFYDSVVEAIRIVSRYNDEREEFDFPGTASKCITGIREIAAILISYYIKRESKEKRRAAESFMTVFNTEVNTDIAKAVTETQVRRKIEKQVILPTLDDVTLLARHIDVKRNEFFEKLSMTFSYENWAHLAEATIASIMVFNRKRVGDVEDILCDEFKRRQAIDESTGDQLYRNLSEEEKKVARQYSRMTVRGKKGHPVFVMLKPEFERSIELLLFHRKDAGIPEKNKFLFALPSSVGQVAVMNAYVILRKFAFSCGAKDPSNLNGTLLRKHLATHCASMELNDSRVADVADFMGHSEAVHRQFYRQNTIERQFVHLPQVLEVSQGNATVSTFPNQMNTKQMTHHTDVEREGLSTSQPKKKRRRS